MIKIIERKNGSNLIIGFYKEDAEDKEIEKLQSSLKSICVDAHKDRAIVVPEGTEVELIRFSEKE